MKKISDLDTEEMDFLQNARMDSDRMIMGIILVALIFGLWFVVILTGIENRLLDGLLGATVSGLVLIIQFFFRASGHKK